MNSSEWQRVVVPHWLRWSIQQRLHELSIPTSYPPSIVENALEVKVDDAVAAVQLRSVVQQFRASRPELVAWLEQCWWLSPHAQ